jgi:hypothetical protein
VACAATKPFSAPATLKASCVRLWNPHIGFQRRTQIEAKGGKVACAATKPFCTPDVRYRETPSGTIS